MELSFKDNTLHEIKKGFCSGLDHYYDDREAESIFFLVAGFYLDIERSHYLIEKSKRLSESEILHFEKALIRLKQNEPIQYILEEVEFLDCVLNVDSSVLIPRPETEELVALILKENDLNRDLNILDIGTGSGCIPIALKRAWRSSNISAIDVSESALELATANAKKNAVEVHFFLDDILNPEIEGQNDIIVSNPPYVEWSRKERLEKRVVEQEPNLALFVPDDDPLIFYKAIKNFADKNLKNKGLIYLELNEELSKETASLFSTPDYSCRILNDLGGLPRFLRISKKK